LDDQSGDEGEGCDEDDGGGYVLDEEVGRASGDVDR